MNEVRFPRWIAAIGVFAGMIIATGVPVATLLFGTDLVPSARLVIIILALIVGGAVAGFSAVVGITLPTAVMGAAIDLSRTNEGAVCCEPRPDDECRTHVDRESHGGAFHEGDPDL